MNNQVTDISKELAVFKKYGYTENQMVNLDFTLTPQEISDMPQELKTALASYAGKMAAKGKSLNKKSLSGDFWGNPFAAFVTGAVLGFAMGYLLKTVYTRIDYPMIK